MVLSKYHLPLRETRLCREMTDSRSRARNVDKPGHLVISESKEAIRDYWGHVNRTQGST